jgi:tRNA (cmo5U34)-methyltransferase
MCENNHFNGAQYSADEFDCSVRKSLPFYESFHGETINLVKTIKGDKGLWLDTGCGTGSLIQKAAGELQGMRFMASDPSSDMLKRANDKLKGLINVRILNPAPTIDLAIAPDEPDIITAIQAHHYFERESHRRTTQKCYQLLSAEGLFITFENIRPRTHKAIEIGKRYWKNFEINAGKDEDAATEHLQRFDQVYFPITVDEHLRLYESVGFKIVELFWYSYMQAGFYCIK